MNRSKLAHALVVRVAQASPSERVPVIVQFHPESKSPKAMRAFAQEAPVRRLLRLFPSASMAASPQEIAALSRDRRIERIWLDTPVHAFLDASVPLVQAPKIWEMGYTGRGVRIAILDTGIDANHPDLKGRIGSVRDFTDEGPEDHSGHGTHVAGIVAGDGRSSRGKYRGVAPQASLLIGKVLRRDGGGLTSEVMAGLDWAVDERAEVANLSLGTAGPADGRDPLSQACDAAAGKGLILCVAAGNGGPGRSSIGSPAAARQVIAVGASTDDEHVAKFSARGPTSDGRSKPEIVAPGVGIVSLRAQGTSMGQVVDGRYTSSSGTSMATPHVTGAIALLLQAFPQLRPDDVKDLLFISAWGLGEPKEAQGAGRLDALGAFKVAQQPRGKGCLLPVGWMLGRK